jgi:NAD-dependent SIR2 family protein deacetylase
MAVRSRPKDVVDRLIELSPNAPGIPERLLLAHSRGEVVFIAGAGVSQPADMPDFRELVLRIYERLDNPTYQVMSKIPRTAHNQWTVKLSGLTPRQAAEVRRFLHNDYDVVLGLLERRLDEGEATAKTVRDVVCELLRDKTKKPASIHKSLLRLADRGGTTTLLTTNFDRLFEIAARQLKISTPSHALGGIPRPGRSLSFAGILHIHGTVPLKAG